MIPRHLIDQIQETAPIEEVIGEYVELKKKGANYVGLCPFHNEKTPSFYVSPVKSIYKCFGCGQSGNSVKFLMEHEHLSFVEALKMLAGKYNITIDEEPESQEAVLSRDKKENLHVINAFAQKFFTKQLFETPEGKSVGLSYFKERKFREGTMEKFHLGYNPGGVRVFANDALKEGFDKELLTELGLISYRGDSASDFFRERVIFPIQNLSGKIVGFAGRTLRNDKNIPKYINSPESVVYNKSKVLYGLFQARQDIRRKDECLLVEGYTDVISLNQGGIENVVASSGTSLTHDQVKLIGKFTSNITMLYDGDEAGVKAAMRGLQIVLEEGLNVRIVVLPEKEDPDSFMHSIGTEAFSKYIESNARDLISFQTEILMKSTRDDPVGKTSVIREIVGTIALIPDPIKRQLYVKECSHLMGVGEQLLITEVNKITRSKLRSNLGVSKQDNELLAEQLEQKESQAKFRKPITEEEQEWDIIRLLLESGDMTYEEGVTVADHILQEITENNIQFDDLLCRQFIIEIRQQIESGAGFSAKYFINHPDTKINEKAISFTFRSYELSENWEKMHNIFVLTKEEKIKKDILSAMNRLKLKKVMKLIAENGENMQKATDPNEINRLIRAKIKLQEFQVSLANSLNTVILR